jgi:hypothetical protein
MQKIKEFKASYENCNRLGPKNKENNALWQLVSEICREDVFVHKVTGAYVKEGNASANLFS